MNADIHTMIAQLTRTHTIGTPYDTDDGTRFHYVRVPALLAQLENAEPTSSGDKAPGGGGGAKSQPPSHIEALDTIHHIDRQAAAWVRALGDDDPATTLGCVIRVGALYPAQDDNTRDQIIRDVRNWWTQARVVTGLDEPSWRPDNTCPLCGTRGTLRVNRVTLSAVCIEGQCREVWTEETISLLAEHIKLENRENENDTIEGDAA
jgi:hypothetical protein